LLAEIEQEAYNLKKSHVCLAVYSNNDAMLNLLEKSKFTLNIKAKESAFSLIDLKTKEKTDVYTYVMCKELIKKRS